MLDALEDLIPPMREVAKHLPAGHAALNLFQCLEVDIPHAEADLWRYEGDHLLALVQLLDKMMLLGGIEPSGGLTPGMVATLRDAAADASTKLGDYIYRGSAEVVVLAEWKAAAGVGAPDGSG